MRKEFNSQRIGLEHQHGRRFIVLEHQYGQPRSQGTLSTSRKYPGCGWSRVYVYKSNPHRGWIIDLVLSTLSMEVKVVLLFYRSWKLKASCFRDPA